MEQPNNPEESGHSQLPVPSSEESIFQESDFSMEGYDKHIRTARNILFVVAVIQLFGIFSVMDMEDPARAITIGILVAVALAFAGLGLWTKKRPYAALLTALILYGSLLILDAILEPSTIIKGIVLKIGVIVALISGLRNAKEAADLKEAFGK